MNEFNQETWEMSAAKNPENPQSDFVTLCHGEPWSGNVQYRYSTTIGVNNNNVNKSEVNEEEIQTPVESVFGGMFQEYLLSQLKTIQLFHVTYLRK